MYGKIGIIYHRKISHAPSSVGNYDVILEHEMKKGSNRIGDKAYTYAENLLRPHRKHPSYLRMASAWLDIEPVAKAKKR